MPLSSTPSFVAKKNALQDSGGVLPAESAWGHVVPFQEVFLKQGCESTRQWAFVTFATAEEAVSAQEQTHGVLTFEGSIRPCQVGRGGEEMIGKDQDENEAFKGYTKIIEHSQ